MLEVGVSFHSVSNIIFSTYMHKLLVKYNFSSLFSLEIHSNVSNPIYSFPVCETMNGQERQGVATPSFRDPDFGCNRILILMNMASDTDIWFDVNLTPEIHFTTFYPTDLRRATLHCAQFKSSVFIFRQTIRNLLICPFL